MNTSISTYSVTTLTATTDSVFSRCPFAGTDPRKGRRTPLNNNRYSEQRDAETGLNYFGARYSTSFRDVSWQRPQASLGALLLKRYYDADLLTGWLSVDPMADKYPSMSPYAYCAWNPILYIDPNGKEKVVSFSNESKDNRISCAAENSPDNAPVIHLWSHGLPFQIQTYGQDCLPSTISNYSEMDKFLKEESYLYQSNTENNTLILVLHSCLTGQGENNIAKEISSGLNLLVVAPTEAIQIQTENEGLNNENSYELGTMRVSSETNKIEKAGVWNVYYRGILVDTLNHSYSPTFNNPQATIEHYENIYKQNTQEQ